MNLSQDNEDAAVTEATEEKEDSGAGDLINLGASALHGLLGLLGAKIDIIRSLLTNKVRTQEHLLARRRYWIYQDLHEHVGKTVEFGLNVTKGLVGAKVGAIRSAAELVRRRTGSSH